MKRDNILKTVAGCIALLCYSCNENDLTDQANGAYDDNRIRFHVTTGPTVEADSRSLSTAADDTTNLLDPLVLKSPEWEQPLYLHTYVADESERSSESFSYSRAAQVNNIDDFSNQNKKEGFYVSSSSFITPFQTATPVGESQTIWTTKKAYYWPNNENTYFFSAYAPASAKDLLGNLSVANKQISFDYTVPKSEATDQDATVQPDLMFAVKNCNRATSEKGNVPLNFRHALSAIKFAVRDVVDGTIESISISGVYGSGSCVYKEQTADTETTEQETTTAENYEFTWTVNESIEKCTYTQNFDYEIKNAPTTSPTDGDESKDIVLNDNNPNMTFMLIPQVIPNDAEIKVVFKRKKDEQEFELKGKINDNNVTEWEPGKEYVYTISTNSANWIYVFEVTGCEQEINDDEPQKGEFKENNNSIIVNQTVTEGAYYKVKSYKYRANNPNIQQAVDWKISKITNGETTLPKELDEYKTKIDDTSIEANKWMPTKTNEDNGSTEFKEYNIEFYPQMTGTDWEGDWELRARDENGKINNPIDLSTISEDKKMNTANCYVVNAPGYYKFPLVYGNAIKNGGTNSASYIYSNTSTNYINKDIYPALNKFTDYNGSEISTPKITGAQNAILVWQDAYNLISEVELKKGTDYDYVSFKVNQDQLQQGNAVLAIRDNTGTIMWSWHIWITEHWTDDKSLQIGLGDVGVDVYDTNNEYIDGNEFTVAPYSLGWCDPKNVWYLKRTGTMTFVQAESNNNKSLVVEQREKKIEYWIGNNVYYQFGRKDPMVGFMNDNSVVKYNFGKLPYRIEAQTKTIQDGIQHPNVLFAGANVQFNASAYLNVNDWLSTSYYNLWNNTHQSLPNKIPSSELANYHYSGIKTVYDPCPAGYQVPPVGFFRIITNGNNNSAENTDNYKEQFNFNGTYLIEPNNVYLYQVKAKEEGKYVNFHATGHRWYAENYKNLENYHGGDNFNPKIVYLWSNQIYFHVNNRSAYGLALGLNDEKKEYASNFEFIGRRAMARPVRPVKEFTESNK